MSFTFDALDEHTLIVRVGTMLDFRSADAFKAACQEKIQAGARSFILDFSRTKMLDSVGLGAIFSVYRHVTPQDGHVIFAAPGGVVKTLIDVTHIHRIFPIVDSVEDAKAVLG